VARSRRAARTNGRGRRQWSRCAFRVGRVTCSCGPPVAFLLGADQRAVATGCPGSHRSALSRTARVETNTPERRRDTQPMYDAFMPPHSWSDCKHSFRHREGAKESRQNTAARQEKNGPPPDSQKRSKKPKAFITLGSPVVPLLSTSNYAWTLSNSTQLFERLKHVVQKCV
jgi:hypothetical protein